MKIVVQGAVLYLGRPRKDGYRSVERVRLTNWRAMLPALRSAKIPAKMFGKRLRVKDDPQLLLPFSE
jgi:hypothetical protein